MLLPVRARRCAHAFYALARLGDDIADSAVLGTEEKRARLYALKSAVCGSAVCGNDGAAPGPEGVWVKELESALADWRGGAPPEGGYVRALLDTLFDAFLQDVRCDRYQNWEDLVRYCRLSAVPVGRFLVALTGGLKTGEMALRRGDMPGPDGDLGLRATDALSMALQILNHVQDLGDDYRILDRLYAPQCWLDAEGARREDLGAAALTPALARVKARMLDGADAWLRDAEGIGRNFVSSRLRMEARGIHAIACALSRRLRRGDPLVGRITLSRLDMGGHFLWGIMRWGGLKREDFRRH